MAEWKRDVLGEGFESLTLDLGEDTEGPLVATLVRSLPRRRSWWRNLIELPQQFDGVDVCYVHGWSDYFFQKDLARFWTERGARFFALDLRKYGRSYRDGQTHGYVEDLAEYDVEISRAVELIREDGRKLVLMGHSTGGLVLSLWASRNPDAADALLLNSPWLDFQITGASKRVFSTLVDLTARINPKDTAPQLDFGFYSRAQREVLKERMPETNLEWRPERSMPIRAGWLHAIMEGQERVQEGLSLNIPVGVLLSLRSVNPMRWSDELTSADTVLTVDDVAEAALKLGKTVTIERIDGALHDVFLSAPEPTAEAYARMERWVAGFVTP